MKSTTMKSTTLKSTTTTTHLRLLRVLGPAALGLVLGVGAPACGGDGDDDAGGSSGPLECEQGMSQACECTGGSMGTQTCAQDGTSLGPCMCGTDDGASGTRGSADASDTGEPPGSTGPTPVTDTGADGSTSEGPTGTSEDTSTNGAAPTAQINHPGDGAQRPAGVVIPFIGEASDPEDGVLTGAALVWTDSVEGEIGQGESFDTMLFTLGEHTITLTVTDADGNVGEDSITLTIFE